MHWYLVALVVAIALVALAVFAFVWSVLHDDPPRPRPFGPLSGRPPVAYEICQFADDGFCEIHCVYHANSAGTSRGANVIVEHRTDVDFG